MAEPRRAAAEVENGDQGGTRRSLVLGILVGALAVAVAVGAIMVYQAWAGSADQAPPTGQASGDRASGGQPSGVANSPTPSPSATPSSDDQEVAAAVAACTRQVQTAEKVITAATTGLDHWRRHVQAQADHLNGRISQSEMEAEFKRTKLAGPDDEKAWKAAIKEWHQDDSACAPVSGADKESASTLEICGNRLAAIEEAMPAAEHGMHDWMSHLADMRRSAAGGDPDPMDTWMHAYHAAPKNLDAWKSAKDDLAEVPACTG